jgi:hypothetical protein
MIEDSYSVTAEKLKRDEMLKELEKKDMSVSHMSKAEFEEYIRNKKERRKKNKKLKVKRCKCK